MYQLARVRYEERSEKVGRPRDEVETWRMVFPAPPIKSDEEAIVESPVPPRVAAKVPVVLAKAIANEEVARLVQVLPFQYMRSPKVFVIAATSFKSSTLLLVRSSWERLRQVPPIA